MLCHVLKTVNLHGLIAQVIDEGYPTLAANGNAAAYSYLNTEIHITAEKLYSRMMGQSLLPAKTKRFLLSSHCLSLCKKAGRNYKNFYSI